MTSIEPVRFELLAALSRLSQIRPEWRLGQTLANLAMTAGRLDPGGVWDLEDEEALAAARILIEQSIGRGLRLPYGKRTGVTAVDRLNIIAHDKFQEIVEEANKPDSAIRLQTLHRRTQKAKSTCTNCGSGGCSCGALCARLGGRGGGEGRRRRRGKEEEEEEEGSVVVVCR